MSGVLGKARDDPPGQLVAARRQVEHAVGSVAVAAGELTVGSLAHPFDPVQR